MNRLIVILLILNCGVVWGEPTTLGYYSPNSYYTVETECKICSKDISESVKRGYSGDSFYADLSACIIPKDRRVYKLCNISVKYDVCLKCYELYHKNLRGKITEFAKTEINKIIKENTKRRKEVQEKKELQRKQNIEKQIKELQEELEE